MADLSRESQGDSLAEVWDMLSQTDSIADQAGLLPPCPTFSGGKELSHHLFS